MKSILIVIKDVIKYILNQGAFWILLLIVILTKKRKSFENDKSKPQKLAWFGAYGNTNIGDDLIFFSIKQFVPDSVEINLSCRQQVPTTDYGVKTFYKGENVFNYGKYKQIIKSSSHVILGGGGLFEYYKFSWPARRVIMNYLAPLMLAIIYKKPFAIVGMGVNEGVIANKPFKYAFKAILSRASFIITRDQKSVDGLHNNGVSGNITWTYDPVFSLSVSSIDPAKLVVPAKSKTVKKIGLLLWPYFLWPNFYKNYLAANSDQLQKHEKFVNGIKTLIDNLKQSGYELIYPLFHFSDKIILDEMGVEYIDKISIAEYSQQLLSCDLLISMRYHGLITALCEDIPVISIPVQEKMYALIKNFNYKQYEFIPSEIDAARCFTVINEISAKKQLIEKDIKEKNVAIKKSVIDTYTTYFTGFFN